ncbi:MAG TPA: malto-oligosyltrehalose synthase, partial [Candidatus Binatia bacterium]|nr:malto-oligosyltrehalose synthase [Candidatus Binatia bacterium]
LERLKAYLIKAVHEAKVHTEWLKPDLAYEEAFVNFAEAILTPADDNRFLDEFVPFARRIARCAMFNSLGQTLVKIAAPGIPDIYQGTELWDLSFVDPDNRRPVDYDGRRRLLGELRSAESTDRFVLLDELLANWQDGRIKLYLMHKLLSFRRAHAELFSGGDYTPLKTASGLMSDRICAFARRHGGSWIVALAPRLTGEMVFNGSLPIGEVWSRSTLALPADAPVQWIDAVSGASIETGRGSQLALDGVFKRFPVALLYHEETADLPLSVEESTHATATQSVS